MWCSVAVATSMFSQKWEGEVMKGDLWAQLGNICGLGIAWELEVRSGLGKKSVQHLCSCIDGFHGAWLHFQRARTRVCV